MQLFPGLVDVPADVHAVPEHLLRPGGGAQPAAVQDGADALLLGAVVHDEVVVAEARRGLHRVR